MGSIFILICVAILAATKIDAANTCSIINPPPSGSKCGLHGRVYPEVYYPAGDPQILNTVEECALSCSRQLVNASQNQNEPQEYGLSFVSWCNGFEYDTEAHVCQLGLKPVAGTVHRNPRSSRTYYDTACFECTRGFCDQPFGAQLLDNGNFEGELFGPWTTEDAILSKNGSNSAYECVIQGKYGPSCLLTQNPNMCDGHSYKLEFDFLVRGASHVGDKYALSVSVGNAFGTSLTYTSVAHVPRYASWNHAAAYVTMYGFHTGPYFEFSPGSPRAKQEYEKSILVDNVKYSHVPPPSIKPKATSPIMNGGFETGTLSPGWTTKSRGFASGKFAVVSPGLENSKYALFYDFTKFALFESPYLDQVVATTPNTTYLLSFDTFVYGAQWLFSVQAGPEAGQSLNTVQVNAGLQSFSIPIVATTNETALRLYITTYYQSQNITVDNIQMLEVESDAFYGTIE